jgi:hypothetical protein
LDELLGELRKTLLPAFRVAPLNEEILAFDIASLAKPLSECCEKVWAARWQAGLNVPDLGDPHRLLRARRERPRDRRAAEQRDEVAPFQLIELHSVPRQPGPLAEYRFGKDQSAGNAAKCGAGTRPMTELIDVAMTVVVTILMVGARRPI